MDRVRVNFSPSSALSSAIFLPTPFKIAVVVCIFQVSLSQPLGTYTLREAGRGGGEQVMSLMHVIPLKSSLYVRKEPPAPGKGLDHDSTGLTAHSTQLQRAELLFWFWFWKSCSRAPCMLAKPSATEQIPSSPTPKR